MSEDDLFAAYQNPARESSQSKVARPLVPSAHRVTNGRKAYVVKSLVSKLWQLPYVAKFNPSPNPVSLERKDIPLIRQRPYVVAEKTDGVQYLLLLGRWPRNVFMDAAAATEGAMPNFSQEENLPFAVMINRNYDIYEVRVVADETHFEGSLFIGELVWEYEKDSNEPTRQLYLVYEVVATRGHSLVQEAEYMKRYFKIVDLIGIDQSTTREQHGAWLEQARRMAAQGKIVSEGNAYGLMFRPKHCTILSHLEKLWQQTRQTLRHPSDGLIFTPALEPIRTGTQPTLLKWKPHHTIDLELRGTRRGTGEWQFELFFRNRGKLMHAAEHGLPLKSPLKDAYGNCLHFRVPLVCVPNEFLKHICKHYQDRGECMFESVVEFTCKLPAEIEWFRLEKPTGIDATQADEHPVIECSPTRLRSDKQSANDMHTLERTLVNIQEAITIRELRDIADMVAKEK